MDSYLPLLLVIIITIAVIFLFHRLQNRKWTDQWRELSETYGMEVKHGSWSMPGYATGDFRGRRLSFNTYSHEETNYNASAYALSVKKIWYTHMTLSVENQPDRGMTLWKKGFTDLALRSLGTPIGDEWFNKTFIAHGNPKEFLVNVLNPPQLRQNILQAHWPRGSTLVINGKHLTFEMKGRVVAIGGLISLFDLLCDIAEAVEQVG